jgi:hypothetical protein
MTRFMYNDFRYLERTPTSPSWLQTHITNLVYSSVNSKAKVETVNPETGEYRIILHGTLDMETPWFGREF